MNYFGVVDIGNSGIKAARAETKSRNLIGSVQSIHWLPAEVHSKSPPLDLQSQNSKWASVDDRESLGQLFEQLSEPMQKQDREMVWRISSVQPRALANAIECLADRFPRDRIELISFVDIPMRFCVDAPEAVGIDRLLAAWGAWQARKQDRPLIVIQAGTAVTVDWVSERGEYGGGAIMPGLTLALKFLALGTAHLPWLAPPKNPNEIEIPGRNTQDAILAGVSACFVGGIELLQRRYRELYSGDASNIETIVSGGDGLILSQSIHAPFRIIDHLVLTALAGLP